MTENFLILKCKEGDGEAFRKLLLPYKDKLYGYLLRFCGNVDLADELFQDTLVRVWQGIKKYNEQKKFSSWLFTIAHNVAIDGLRKKKREQEITEAIKIEYAYSENIISDEIENKELVNKIEKYVMGLSEKQKRVFLLRQHGEFSFKEISEITNEPLNTVLSHMRYAIKKIKKQFDKNNE